MTRTSVRRYVDLSDGRLVIRTIVVEAPVAESVSKVEQTPAPAKPRDDSRVERFRSLNRARHALRGARQE